MKPDVDVALHRRYRLVRRIAVGGMGEVWAAHDEALARDVAVKVLREEFTGDEAFLARFRAEARNSAHLSHPNIAQLYDYGEEDGTGYLVMELVQGEPLSDLLDRQPVLPTRRLLPVLAQTARALHAAHTAGVVHRDVKPGNILLSRAGPVKITDFGIATAADQAPMTATGMVMGTAQYLSPEQAVGGAATPRSDIYALGVVAYECLAGHRPFTGQTAFDIAVAHVNAPVPPLPAGVDPQLSALVVRMLAKDPERRPAPAAAIAESLEALHVRTMPGAPPSPPGRPPARPVDVLPEAPPPTVPPRPRERREDAEQPEDAPVTRPFRSVAALPDDEPSWAPAPGAQPPRRTSTTTGQRWGRWSRPLVALVLLVVLALLAAAWADTLEGQESQGLGPREPVGRQAQEVASTGVGPWGGTIAQSPGDAGAGRAEHLTTARDQ